MHSTPQTGALIATPLMIQEAIRILGSLQRAIVNAGEVAALSSLEKLLNHAQASAEKYEGRIEQLKKEAEAALASVGAATEQLKFQLGEERRHLTRLRHDWQEHNLAILNIALDGPLPPVKMGKKARERLDARILPLEIPEPMVEAVTVRQTPGRKAKE